MIYQVKNQEKLEHWRRSGDVIFISIDLYNFYLCFLHRRPKLTILGFYCPFKLFQRFGGVLRFLSSYKGYDKNLKTH